MMCANGAQMLSQDAFVIVSVCVCVKKERDNADDSV